MLDAVTGRLGQGHDHVEADHGQPVEHESDRPPGLSPADVLLARSTWGMNRLPGAAGYRTTEALLRQFASPIIWLLAAATAISMAIGDVIDGAIILTIILASAAIGFWQEHQAGRAMQRLARELEVDVEVVRSGVEQSVPLQDVVMGDLVQLRAGDLIPADLCIITANRLLVDEATISGEAEPIEKAPHDDDRGLLWQGTHVISGSGAAVVTAIGATTRFGQIASALNRAAPSNSFERGTRSLGRMLIWTTGVLAALLLVINLALGRSWIEAALFSLALAVGLTPQMLPAIIAVALSSGARRLARASVLIRRPDAIAEFGAMSDLCCDKTGTLTEGSVRLVSATAPTGEASPHVLRLAYINATLQAGFTNPMDAAIVAASPHEDLPQLRQEIPYDFERRMLTVVCVDGDDCHAITKGAFATVISRCTRIRQGTTSVPIAAQVGDVRRTFAEMSIRGLRVLAVATRSWDASRRMGIADEVELTLEGLLAFEDPVKPDARDAVTALADLGITVRLITGDNALAARHAAEAVAIPVGSILTGTQVSTLDDPALRSSVADCRVFAEIDPLGKKRIVQALRSNGRAVGVLGDGINDTAALNAADVGISVESAADCARQAASIVLLDKDLHILANGVRIGRQTFANTLKYVHVTISANFGNMLSMVLATAFLPFLPMLPVQILLLNFLSDIPALTISTDRVDVEDLRRPTFWNIADIRRFMIVFGCISSLADLTLFFVLERILHVSAAMFQSSWFVASTLTELIALLVLRTRRPAWRSRPSHTLVIASGLVAALTVVLPFTQPGHTVGLVPIAASAGLAIATVTAAYLMANEVAKAIKR